MTGIRRRLGASEDLAGESGRVVSGEKYELSPGDVVVFRGDQKHSSANSAVVLGPCRIG
jgi:hypothetical protein